MVSSNSIACKILIIAPGFISTKVLAQHANLPLNRQFMIQSDVLAGHLDTAIHTSVKPYMRSAVYFPLNTSKDTSAGGFKRKLALEHFLRLDEQDFKLAIDPVFNWEFGIDRSDDSPSQLWVNTRGARVEGVIANKVSFASSIYENQAFLPDYLSDYTNAYDNVPGQGRVKPFKTDGFDYAMASGYISVMLHEKINLQLGNDRFFIGDGYRSMLLSDNGFNYPFVKFNSLLFGGKLQLTQIYTSLQSLNRLPYNTTPEALFERKAGTFHYINYIVSRRIHLGLFEGTIWQRMNDGRASIPFNYGFLNPIPGLNSTVLGMNDRHNTVLGFNSKIKLSNKLHIYGQVAMDDPANSKTGLQIGARAMNFLVDNLHLRLEYNQAPAYMYGHTLSLQNYAHFNQPLTHPLGADFTEVIGVLNYNYKKVFTEIKINFSKFHSDTGNLHLGHNIFISEDLATTQDLSQFQTRMLIVNLKLGYLVNPATNMQVLIGLSMRQLDHLSDLNPDHNTTYFYIGFRTALRNYYYDF